MLICVDPGHGGPDPGALGRGGMREADIALDISRHLGRYLRQAGMDVIYTRTEDRELAPGNSDTEELQARCDVANQAKADLFVSIHADAFSQSNVRGAKCFHYPESAKGTILADTIAQHVRVLVQPAVNISSNFYVLKHTIMPAVLVEVGFMTNEADLALLCEPSYRDKLGLVIALGILRAREKEVI